MKYRVAALYIDPRGPYPELAQECWDEARDARNYTGPLPVVARPPCGPWGKLRHMCRKQPADCGPIAVEQVRQWGGVLEHPEHSRLFSHCGLPRPGEAPDAFGGRTIEVCQVDFGHVARKRTWLYMVRTEFIGPLPIPREPTHWVSGGRGREGKKRNTTPVPEGIRICSAQQRRRTPLVFAHFLCGLAEAASAAT